MNPNTRQRTTGRCLACGRPLGYRGRRRCRLLRASQQALGTRPVQPLSARFSVSRAVLIAFAAAFLLVLHVGLAALLWPWESGLLVLAAWLLQGMCFSQGLAQGKRASA